MTERTTDPDAGLEERLEAVASEFDCICGHADCECAKCTARDAVAALAALRERAERAQEQYERAMSIIREDELEDLTEQRDRLRAALEGARALVKSAWCEGHNIGLGDGHPLAGPPHRWEDSDACADLAALLSERPDAPGGEREPEMMDAIELAWGIIANASGGDWEQQAPEWQEAARRWRDRFLPLLVPPALRPTAPEGES